MLFAQGIQKRVLQKLTFVAHDILRVQKFENVDLTTGPPYFRTKGRISSIFKRIPCRRKGWMTFSSQFAGACPTS
jgi:hypothetical protein